MTRAVFVGLCASWLLAACNVASVEEQKSGIAQNQCTTDSECGGGACVNGGCRTSNGTFETMLFAVTPPADASAIAGVQFLKVVSGISTAGGELDLPLELVGQVTGGVTLAPRDCVPKFEDAGGGLATAADSSVPVIISFVPSAGALGLFVSPSAAQSTLVNDKTFQYRVNVPPGRYEIYVEPKHQPDDSCVVPPQLLRGQVINPGAHPLNITLPEPASFALRVSWPPADGALANWTVDMLDPVSGRVISNSAVLALESGGKSYVAKLFYLPVVGDTSEAKAQELVRLSPPANQVAPTVLLARGALSLFSASSGTLSQLTALPASVHVAAQVTAQETPTPAAATVSVVATKIAGIDPGVIASFVRTATAGGDGKFEVDLLPGTYRVSAIPSGNSTLGQASTEWVVADSPDTQAGKLIELPNTLTINGDAFDAAGAIPLSGALAQAIASPASIVTDVLHVALGETVYVPRASNGAVGLGGTFALSSDSGTFDFSVRPLASTRFPWLVMPNLSVGNSSPGLGDLVSPLPVVYSGHVTVPGDKGTTSPVPGALIRTYVYMSNGVYTADSTRADSVLQVAETRSDAAGAFDLLIPAALNAPPK